MTVQFYQNEKCVFLNLLNIKAILYKMNITQNGLSAYIWKWRMEMYSRNHVAFYFA